MLCGVETALCHHSRGFSARHAAQTALLIAATAHAHAARVYTRNPGDFAGRNPGDFAGRNPGDFAGRNPGDFDGADRLIDIVAV